MNKPPSSSHQKPTLSIIKIGGNVIDNTEKLETFLTAFCGLPGFKILVHGGGKMATKLAQDIGLEAKMVNGRRVTDAEMLKIVTMVYAGLINKNIVAQLQAQQCNAIGLSGADGNLISAKKRPIQHLKNTETGIEENIDFGFVGDLDAQSVHTKNLSVLLKSSFIPIFSAITHNGEGQLLNTNADTVASALAVALSQNYHTSLIYCFEKKGVLRNVEDEQSVITEINPTIFETLQAQNIIHSGMLPKLHNAFEAINNGVKQVFIGSADELPLLKTQKFGTRITT
ncbi:MAG: acetylglutamate kinase [Sphingobacteriales bacterium]|nr:MAG: acetylglutamate kinase [Sphingobacteriales bacterium]